MELNTDQLYTDILEYRDELESSLKFLDNKSVSYKVLLVSLNKVNDILEKCKKDLKRKDAQNGKLKTNIV